MLLYMFSSFNISTRNCDNKGTSFIKAFRKIIFYSPNMSVNLLNEFKFVNHFLVIAITTALSTTSKPSLW